jgi:hypothetical protein
VGACGRREASSKRLRKTQTVPSSLPLHAQTQNCASAFSAGAAASIGCSAARLFKPLQSRYPPSEIHRKDRRTYNFAAFEKTHPIGIRFERGRGRKCREGDEPWRWSSEAGSGISHVLIISDRRTASSKKLFRREAKQFLGFSMVVVNVPVIC